jgi:hypothetical protein
MDTATPGGYQRQMSPGTTVRDILTPAHTMEIITVAEAPDGLLIQWLTADITGQTRNIQESNMHLQVCF